MRQKSGFLLTIIATFVICVDLSFGELLPEYEIIDLGTLGGSESGALAINDHGQVVGWSDTSHAIHAFFWDSNKGMIDLGVLCAADNISYASGINDNGQVVGASGWSDEFFAFIWDTSRGMLYLEGIGKTDSEAEAINNAGQVVGSIWGGPSRAFLWDSDHGVIDLGALGATCALSINRAGQVVGVWRCAEGRHKSAFIWDSISGIRDLGTLGGRSAAYGVNDAGQVVGYSEDTLCDSRAFLWDSTHGMTNLGPGFAGAINNAGQVVGSLSSSGPAFYWDSDNGIVILDEFIPPGSRWIGLEFGYDINNRGQIVGTGITNRGEIRAFLMTPVLPTIKVPMKITPQALNCYSKGKWVKAHLVLPAEFRVEDVNSYSLTTVKPLGIKPNFVNTFVNENGLVEMETAFCRSDFCSALRGNWSSETTVAVRGSTTSGQYFYGMDTIKIIDNSLAYLGLLSSRWLEADCTAPDWCEGADIDQDSVVNFNDFAFIAFNLLEER